MGIGSQSPETLIPDSLLLAKHPYFPVIPAFLVKSVLDETWLYFSCFEEIDKKLVTVAVADSECFYFSIFHKFFKSSPNLHCFAKSVQR